MDSLTHIALGAALGTAVLGRRMGPRAALWGAVASTLPDLDVFIAQGDPLRDLTFHRAWSHSLFCLTLAAPLIAGVLSRFERRVGASFREWFALVWLALISHPLLDAFTVYGTQLLLPFSNRPVGLGSIFIIDPLYTLPLIAGTVAAWVLRKPQPDRAGRWNAAGLLVSTLYLGWTVAAQAAVAGVVQRTLAASGSASSPVLVTPTPFNSVLWRVVVMDRDGYDEGYYSLLDDTAKVTFEHHASESGLLDSLRDDANVQRLAWFTKGFYAVSEAPAGLTVAKGSVSSLRQLVGVIDTAAAAGHAAGAQRSSIVMTDVRMGQTPWFVFSFVVAERDAGRIVPAPVRQLPMRRVPPDALARLWRRAGGDVDALR
jgi:inner membrane protein